MVINSSLEDLKHEKNYLSNSQIKEENDQLSIIRDVNLNSFDNRQGKEYKKTKIYRFLFCAQLILCLLIPLLVVSMHFLYEALIMCKYYGSDCSGLWLGLNTNAALLIDIVLYSIIILQLFLLIVCFYIYDLKKDKRYI